MKIWIVNHYAKGPETRGGSRHYDLAKYLTREGHEVTIIASSFSHQTKAETRSYNFGNIHLIETINGIKFIWIKSFSYKKNGFGRILNMLTFSYRAFLIGRNVKEMPDLIIGSSVHPIAAYTGYQLSKVKNSLFYFEERDLWPQTLVDLGKFNENNFIIKLLYKLEFFLYKKSDRIITLFDYAFKYISSKGFSVDKVLYIPNGVDIERYKEFGQALPVRIESKLNELKNSNKFICVYIGSHGIANNMYDLLESAKHLNSNTSIHYLFVGEGDEKSQLIEYAKKEELQNVTFLDAIPKTSIPLLLKNCDCGLIAMKDSSLYKWGYSLNKLYDYVAGKLPIVIKTSYINELVKENSSVIKVNSPKEMAEVILEIKNNSNLYKKLTNDAFKYVVDNHHWGSLAKKLIKTLT
ncbi:glycosyltransferase family 4 protein [Virgibacillus sp. YIM 98842]|uniref:glycosyltransferase family 4 protein n=1 Tax=Virgibacillus sp. YIM 98842 TaxID=2663533 RepID=UPI0013DA01D9|nr:glycosyltransferase family 4 protein [Virgibacillus sp. YIM 98842]